MWGTLALLLVCGSHAAAQAYGAIEGRVLDSAGAPVVGALVSLDNTPFSVTSDAAGVFRLRGLTPGAHQLRIRRLGYEETTQAVTVESGVVARVELRIERAAVGVRGVTVIGSREELAELCAELRLVPGSVQLIEPEELRATRQANFNDVLRFTPGVFVQPRFGAADESQLSIRGSGLRNNFHLRGVNVLVNGMAYRNPALRCRDGARDQGLALERPAGVHVCPLSLSP